MFGRKEIRKFILGEMTSPSIFSYIQSLTEIVSSLRPATLREKRQIEIAQTHLKEVGRHAKRLQEKVSVLEEQVKVLEENKGE